MRCHSYQAGNIKKTSYDISHGGGRDFFGNLSECNNAVSNVLHYRK